MSSDSEKAFKEKLKIEYAGVVSDVYYSLRDQRFTHSQAVSYMLKMSDLTTGPIGLPAHESKKTFIKKTLFDR